MEILYAPQTTNLLNKRVIFLAGPIRCCRNWQEKVLESFRENENDFRNTVIASPRRKEGQVPEKDFSHLMYDSQVKWETDHLKAAGKNGLIAFFLGTQLRNDPEQTFARTTRFELGEWFGELKNRNDVRVIIGYDKTFPGLKYIFQRCKFFKDSNPNKSHQLIVCEEGLDAFANKIRIKNLT